MKGASTLVVEELQCAVLYATEVASPRFVGVATLVADRHIDTVLYATEVASPIFGAVVSTAEELQNSASYAIEIASPGASTLVADKKLTDHFNANKFASPYGFMRLKSHPRSDYE